MISTGNDIVALNAINIARSKQPEFYSKFISAAEKDLFDKEAADKIPLENFVWLLWSIKEAAFKYLQRITPTLVFSPTKFIVRRLVFPEQTIANFREKQIEAQGFEEAAVYKAVVEFAGHTIYSRSVVNGDFIASFVNADDDLKKTFWGVKWVEFSEPAFQSEAVREFLIHRLSDLFPGMSFQINKSPHGYPILLSEAEDATIPISLAHHDHYVAYSFQTANNN